MVSDTRSRYVISVRKFSGGERYAVLLAEGGIPLWYPTLFITTQYRNSSKPSNTMRNALSAIRMVLMWADQNEIDLERRFNQEQYLDASEIRLLATYLKKKAAVATAKSKATRQGVVVSIELARARSLICPPLSGPETMLVWTTKGTLNAEQEAQAGRDYRQAA